MADLFETGKCDLPAVPKVDFDFVSECSVAPAPPQLVGHGAPELPFAPLAFPDCMSLEASGQVSETDDEEPSLNITVTRTQIDRGTRAPRCVITLDFLLSLPAAAAFNRVYRGYIHAAATGCSLVPVRIPERANEVVDASVWIRNCCSAEHFVPESQVWLVYSTEYGWGIISQEQILIVPIKLTSNMVAGEATAKLYYGDEEIGDTITIHDRLSQFPCAFNNARGFCICNNIDGTGEWDIVAVEQYATWIEFKVATTFSGLGPIEVSLTDYHDGADPSVADLVDVHNKMEFTSSVDKIGRAMRRDDCGYDTWQIQCSEASEGG